ENASLAQRVWYRIYRNPFLLMFVFAPVHFVFLQRLPLEHSRPSKEIWLSVMGTNIGIGIYYGTMIYWMGLVPFLLVYVPIVMFSSIGAVWLFYIQHQFEDTYWKRDQVWTYRDATMNGSSFYDLPRWGHWISGNIGYHHIHHLNPRIPNYRLAACHAANPELQRARHISFGESFGLANLALWDEQAERLISFKEYEQGRDKMAGEPEPE
ncbi:MAG: fatty acid desaturase, partial [Pseudomonadales bacterium]